MFFSNDDLFGSKDVDLRSAEKPGVTSSGPSALLPPPFPPVLRQSTGDGTQDTEEMSEDPSPDPELIDSPNKDSEDFGM